MPNINTSVDDMLLKYDRRFDFATGSSKPFPLTTDPVETDLNIYDVSEENKAHSTITREAGSKLNPNCEPFVPT
ncbi:hypothetical protein R6Q57_009175, partial [Mikania cordata]